MQLVPGWIPVLICSGPTNLTSSRHKPEQESCPNQNSCSECWCISLNILCRPASNRYSSVHKLHSEMCPLPPYHKNYPHFPAWYKLSRKNSFRLLLLYTGQWHILQTDTGQFRYKQYWSLPKFPVRLAVVLSDNLII